SVVSGGHEDRRGEPAQDAAGRGPDPVVPPGEGHDRAPVRAHRQAQVMRRPLDVAVRQLLDRTPAAAARAENGVMAGVRVVPDPRGDRALSSKQIYAPVAAASLLPSPRS